MKVSIGSSNYLFFDARCANADAAALFEAVLVRPSRITAEAAVAAFAEVVFVGTTWDSALPAAAFDAAPVDELERTAEDFCAAFTPVTLITMMPPQMDNVQQVCWFNLSPNTINDGMHYTVQIYSCISKKTWHLIKLILRQLYCVTRISRFFKYMHNI